MALLGHTIGNAPKGPVPRYLLCRRIHTTRLDRVVKR